MVDANLIPQSVQTILVTRLDGMGDIVLGTMLLSALHRRWPGAYIKMLVRPGMESLATILPKWVRLIPLPFDQRKPIANNEEAIASLIRNASEDCQADLTIIGEFNRDWVSEIIAAMSEAELVLAFDGPSGANINNRGVRDILEIGPPDNMQLVHAEMEWRESAKYAAMINALGMEPRAYMPGGLTIRPEDQTIARTLWPQIGIPAAESLIVFPGNGEGALRSLPAMTWNKWIKHLCQSFPVLLLGSEKDGQVIDSISIGGLPDRAKRLLLPTPHVGAMAALLDSAAAYIGADTGPMHVSAVLGKPTLGIFGGGNGTERFLPAGPRAAAARMQLTCFDCQWLCPFDERLCLTRMPIDQLIEAGDAFLASFLGDSKNADPLSPRIFELTAPPELPNVILGALMRQNRHVNRFNHEVIEHHDYLARVNQDRQGRIAEMGDALGHIANILAEMARQNRAQDESIAYLNRILAEMTRHNTARDEAIGHNNTVIADMSRQNAARDQAITQLQAAVNQLLGRPKEQPMTAAPRK